MTSLREFNLFITDESGDVLRAQTIEWDEDLDWSDDDEALLASVKTGDGRHVNLSRADLTALRDFLNEVLVADAEWLEEQA